MPRNFYSICASAESDSTSLTIYDEIGFWGTEAKSFEEKLRAVKTPKLEVHLNSPGGNVFDGVAIYNMLKAFKGEVTVFVDGWAASIASIIAMAGKTIVMPVGTHMFIHNPLFPHASGNAEELREHANFLDKVAKSLVSIYMARSGKDEKTVRSWMDNDTLFTAEECVANGLADRTAAALTDEAEAKWGQIAAYYPSLESLSARAGASAATKPNNTPDIMTPQEIKALQDRVSELEASNKTIAAAAVAEAKASEKKRKEGIIALRDKHNKNGDLDGPAATALAGETTVDEFKDQILDIADKRTLAPAASGTPTREAVKPGVAASAPAGGDKKHDEDTIEGCRAALAATKDSSEKSRLAAKLHALRFPAKTR